MGKGFNVSASAVNKDDNSTTVNFNATVLSQYSDTPLTHCDVSGATIDLDLFQAKVTVQIYATCVDPRWPALLHTEEVYSVDRSRLVDDSLYFGNIITPDPTDNASIPDAMNNLASDLWNRMKAVYLRSSEVLPTIRGLRMVNDRNCALVVKDKQACYDAPLSLTNNSIGFFLYPNLTIATTDTDQVDWNVTTDNFINSLFAAARYDFGANMTTNLYVNQTARQTLITRSDAGQLDNVTALMNTLGGAETFLSMPTFPPPKIARVRTSYMCNVMKMKPIASFIISVLGLAFAIFGVVFAAAVAIVKKLTGKDLGASAPAAIHTLSPITSITSNRDHPPDDTNGDYAEGQNTMRRRKRADTEKLSAGSSNDLDSRFDSRTTSPAPSYHRNARGADIYQSLGNRSPDAGSGSVTPSASGLLGSKFSSFASLTGLGKSFLPTKVSDVDLSKMPGANKFSVPGMNRLSGQSNKWMNMAGAGAAGAAAGAAASSFANATHLTVPGQAPVDSGDVSQPLTMFTRSQPATAPQPQLAEVHEPNEYAPFAYPETIHENDKASPMMQQSERIPDQSGVQAQPQSQSHGYNNYAPAAAVGAAGLAGGAAAYAAHHSDAEQGQGQQQQQMYQQGAQPVTQQQYQSQPPQQQMYQQPQQPSTRQPTIIAVPNRATSPGAPVGPTSPVLPTRVTSPGPPVGHTSSVPSRVTSPGPPVGSRWSTGAPAGVTSPGASQGSSSSVPGRVTSPGPPVGHTSSVPARVTSPGPPVGARSTGAHARTTSSGPPVGATSPTSSTQPQLLAPKPRRAPSPTWLAEQEAAAANSTPTNTSSSTTAAQDAPVDFSAPALDFSFQGTNSVGSHGVNSASTVDTPDSAAQHLQSPLTQIQRSLSQKYSSAQNTANNAASNASNAYNQAQQGFNSNNPFN